MMFPLDDVGLASGLLSGVLFGYVLESAGFGSSCKLTAQFSLRDWSVFKVMFTAIVVAAIGLAALKGFGALDMDGVFVPSVFLWATLLGGALIGIGFAVGGYCPGTSVVGMVSGRVDALVFLAGIVGGTALFAAFAPELEPLLQAAPGPEGQTLPDLLGVPEWAVLAGLAAAGVGVFALGGRIERRFAGPLDAEEITTGHALGEHAWLRHFEDTACQVANSEAAGSAPAAQRVTRIAAHR